MKSQEHKIGLAREGRTRDLHVLKPFTSPLSPTCWSYRGFHVCVLSRFFGRLPSEAAAASPSRPPSLKMRKFDISCLSSLLKDIFGSQLKVLRQLFRAPVTDSSCVNCTNSIKQFFLAPIFLVVGLPRFNGTLAKGPLNSTAIKRELVRPKGQ